MSQVPNLDPTLAHINPSAAQAARYLALDPERPVVFVNLHEYHERAQYAPNYSGAGGPADVSGKEAYHRYLRTLEAIHARVGAKMVIAAGCDVVMVGGGNWHEVVITYYPTRAIAMQLAAFPEYEAAVPHRVAGLKSALALALDEHALDYLPSLRTP